MSDRLQLGGCLLDWLEAKALSTKHTNKGRIAQLMVYIPIFSIATRFQLEQLQLIAIKLRRSFSARLFELGKHQILSLCS